MPRCDTTSDYSNLFVFSLSYRFHPSIALTPKHSWCQSPNRADWMHRLLRACLAPITRIQRPQPILQGSPSRHYLEAHPYLACHMAVRWSTQIQIQDLAPCDRWVRPPSRRVPRLSILRRRLPTHQASQSTTHPNHRKNLNHLSSIHTIWHPTLQRHYLRDRRLDTTCNPPRNRNAEDNPLPR